jgi:hypothetical protein
MYSNSSYNLRDLKKNTDNVRIDHLLEVVDSGKLSKVAKDSAFLAKIVIDSKALNPEELSLLRDAANGPSSGGGNFISTFKLSKQFVKENEESLEKILVGRLHSGVKSTYEARLEHSQGTQPMRETALPVRQEKGLWGRLVDTLSSKPKQQHQDSAMGMR